MNITSQFIVKERFTEYLAKREQWDRDALREQCFRQSERTVAGARAEFQEGKEYALAEIADAQDRASDPEFSFMYGSKR